MNSERKRLQRKPLIWNRSTCWYINENHKHTFRSEEIITLKGHENWGVGMAVASVVQSILRNDNSVKCISTLVKVTRNYCGILGSKIISIRRGGIRSTKKCSCHYHVLWVNEASERWSCWTCQTTKKNSSYCRLKESKKSWNNWQCNSFWFLLIKWTYVKPKLWFYTQNSSIHNFICNK